MRNPYLCLAIVTMLGLAGLLCGIGIILLPLYGKPVPESLPVLAGGVLGSLSSFLVAPPRGSAGAGGASAQVPPIDERIRAL